MWLTAACWRSFSVQMDSIWFAWTFWTRHHRQSPRHAPLVVTDRHLRRAERTQKKSWTVIVVMSYWCRHVICWPTDVRQKPEMMEEGCRSSLAPPAVSFFGRLRRSWPWLSAWCRSEPRWGSDDAKSTRENANEGHEAWGNPIHPTWPWEHGDSLREGLLCPKYP